MKDLMSWSGISTIKRTLAVALYLILSSAMLAPSYGKILTTPDGGRHVGYGEAYTKGADLGFQNNELVFTLSD